MRPSRPPFVVLLAFALTSSATFAQAAAEPRSAAAPPDTAAETFSGQERVTAVDLVVELRKKGRERVGDDRPGGLRPADFTLTSGGVPRPVVAIEAGDEPWSTVLYFDLTLTGATRAARAARDLATVAAELTARGEVSIVVADPEPAIRLAASRDAERVLAVLTQLGTATGADHDLLALRWQAAQLLASGADLEEEAEIGRDELLRRAAAEEAEVVATQLDRLVLAVAEAPPPGVRRLLLLVSSGFDERPAEFYRRLGLPAGGPAPDLAATVAQAAETVAAYGWVVAPVVPLPTRVLRPGFRLGKWRLEVPTKAPAPEYDPTTAGTEAEKAPPLFGVVGKRESERDPEKAAELVALGRALLAQKKPADAEEALEQAYHAYYGDPRTAAEQAEALFLLAEAVEAQGRVAEARELVTSAAELSPATAEARGVVAATLLAPGEPLAKLAATSGGTVLRAPEAIAEAVADFRQRVRLTYQVAGPPDGRLQPLVLVFARDGWALRYPAWGRVAAPDTVAAARARRLLAGDLQTGDLALQARVAGERLKLTAELDGRPAGAVLRLTVGRSGPGVAATIDHTEIELAEPAGRFSHEATIAADPDRPYLVALLEDLDRGRWGGALVDLGSEEEAGAEAGDDGRP